jgi:hypothetical protein
MAGPLSLGVAIPGLVNFSISPLTGVQVRLLDALAPRPAAAAARTAVPASTAQFSPQATAAALSEQLAARLEQFYKANPDLPRLPIRSLQVSYPANGGQPQLTLGPMDDPLPSGQKDLMERLLAGNQQILSQFLSDNDGLMRQLAAANGGVVNLLLTDATGSPTAGAVATPATAAVPAGRPAAAPGALAFTYGPYSLAAGAGTLAAALKPTE